MPEYRFDMGNSGEGESGYVAYVIAKSPEDAAEKLKSWLPMDILAEADDQGLGIKAIAYANPEHVTAQRAELVED